MKNKIAILIIALALGGCMGGSSKVAEKRYCGIIITKGYEHPTSGHKSSRDAKYFIIFKDSECGKHIRVDVSVPTYYEHEIGGPVCFALSGYDLQRYGNSNGEHLK